MKVGLGGGADLELNTLGGAQAPTIYMHRRVAFDEERSDDTLG